MSLTPAFFATVERLLVPRMGTENVAGLLYSLVRITRPRVALEIGMGYTTPWLLRALADNAAEYDADQRCFESDAPDDLMRRRTLRSGYYSHDYSPVLIACDDHSMRHSTSKNVVDVVERLGLRNYLICIDANFRSIPERVAPEQLPIDFAWFDCGAELDYVDFLRAFWPLLNPEHGQLVLHFTYQPVQLRIKRSPECTGQPDVVEFLLPGSILNEIKRQQARQGIRSTFEVLSLVEPHKLQQGSVTLIRRLPQGSRCRDIDLSDDIQKCFGRPEPLPRGFQLD
jgi:hypothetical protein